MKKLKADDRCAVDLLLEQLAGGSGVGYGHCFDHAGKASFPKRVERVERLLSLLSLVPAQDPPVNLVAKTLKHIQRAEARPTMARESSASTTGRSAFQRSIH